MKKVFLLVLVSFCWLLGATLINVPADYETIQAGINAATEGDSVLVAAGIYYENIDWPAVNGIKLIGESEENCIIDGDSFVSVIRFETELGGIIDTTTVIKHFTIQNGWDNFGGGIFLWFSSPSLENVTIIDNFALFFGGGVYCDNSNPNLENVTLTNNSASYNGGGIYCEVSNPNLINVTITNNLTLNSGGGISCCNSSLNLVNIIIDSNSADGYGGGIYCYNSNLSLENVAISSNSADYCGGGIYCDDESNLSFSADNRCNIYANNVQNRESGTDIYSSSFIEVIVDTFTVINPTAYHASPLDNFTFDILNAVINEQIDADLYVSPDGDNDNDGLTVQTPLKTIQHANSIILADSNNPRTIYLANGVYSPSTNGEFFPVDVIDYVSLVGESEAGVVLDAEGVNRVMNCFGVNNATLNNLTLTCGSADYRGGGLYFFESNPSLENVTISDNSAAEFGGGIYCKVSNPNLTNVTISNNLAGYCGGGIYCDVSNPNLTNVTISSNLAGYCGGGIYCDNNSNPSLLNVTISNNSASDDGGGIYCCDSSEPSLENCILWDNLPQEIVFADYFDDNSVAISYSDIQGGEAGIVTNNNGTVYWLSGNIDTDPLFVDAEGGDYHFLAGSPCIDAGNPTSPFDPDGTIADMGAFYYHQDVGINDNELPLHNYQLINFPNPFNGETTISFSLTTNLHEKARIEIFNIKGQKVKTFDVITNGAAGSVIWNGRDETNKPVSSGIYFYKLVAGENTVTQKMLLLK